MNLIRSRDQKLIGAWLFIGMVMVFVQIQLGGITRLTGSGLSITRWEIVTGTVPPLNRTQWEDAFELYKATPQYQHINQGMTLGEFKFIFFWEYIHRLWARTMGFIFIIPLVIFLFRKSITKGLLKRLMLVVAVAGAAAVFGWIMVKSGLEQRPWVNAYKLTIHLGLGILLFICLFITWLLHRSIEVIRVNLRLNRFLVFLFVLACIQVVFGGFVSGMKSALNYPTWPQMNGEWIPSIILDKNHWNADNFLLYDKSGFMPALTQFIHRMIAYVLAISSILFAVLWYQKNVEKWRWISFTLVGIIVVQVSLGILTLLRSLGSIPVLYGTLHQAFGILFLSFLVYLLTRFKSENIKLNNKV